jgi:hypothetical protein
VKTLVLFAFSALFSPLSFAQGSGAVAPAPSGGASSGLDIGAFEVTKTIKLRFVSAAKDGTTIVLAEENGTQYSTKLAKKVSISAEKGAEYAGKKKLGLDNLEPGMLLKVTYRASDHAVLELRILKKKKA